MLKFFYDSKTFLYLKIGSIVLDIRWYAVLILTGAILTYFVARNDYKKAKYRDLDFFDTTFVFGLWSGIIGARIWYCLFFNLSYYLSNPIEIIRIWDGGLAIQGGLVGGVLFVYFYSKKHKYSFLKLADIILPNVLIGQCLGRWGNFVNKECHGPEVSEEFFNGILGFLKDGMYINGHYYEPLFFYESMLCILGWVIIHFVLKKHQNKRGDLAYCYLMWYGMLRFFIEAKRTDSLYLGSIKMAQLTSVVFVILGFVGYLGLLNRFYKKRKPTIIFDIDGTLVDTKESIIAAFTACFEKFDKVENFTEERKQEVVGPALKEEFPKFFPGHSFEEVYDVYWRAQAEVAAVKNHPMEHVPEVLKALKEEGYHIGIVSSRTRDGIEKIMNSTNLREYISDYLGVDDVKTPKPDPEGIYQIVEKNNWNKDVIYVGDTLADAGAAKNYDAYFIAYLSNPKLKEELDKNSNAVITDMNDVLEIIKKKDIFFSNDNL